MIVIVDSGGSNLNSVIFALSRLGVKGNITSKNSEIEEAEKVILPGVGSANSAMERFGQKKLVPTIQNLKQPVLGICLGMQLLFSHSEEGDTDLLGLVPGTVKHFKELGASTIPHMGWNSVTIENDHPLLFGLDNESFFYFVHSYYVPFSSYTEGSCFYGAKFSAIIAKNNFMGCQFHPERSADAGSRFLKNFLEL